MSGRFPSRIVLVGFMGSGKSSAGRAIASALAWRFVDLDESVEEEEGMPISSIFSSRGEAYFREVEDRVAERCLALEDIVMASGGGWAAMPDRLLGLPEGTETIWLKVSAEEAVRRVSSASEVRPLLAGKRPLETARRLLAERESFYGLASTTVDTEGRSVDDVSARILQILSQKYLSKKAE